ncbi:hypothetical protein ABEB36_002824, partial [Hypothenemus hampei]
SALKPKFMVYQLLPYKIYVNELKQLPEKLVNGDTHAYLKEFLCEDSVLLEQEALRSSVYCKFVYK